MQEQAQSKLLLKQYSNTLDVIVSTIKNEGVLALFKGNFTNIMRYSMNQSLVLAFKDLFRDIIKIETIQNKNQIIYCNMLSAGSAAMFS